MCAVPPTAPSATSSCSRRSAASGACRSGSERPRPLEEVELPRPGPYHFAQALLAAAGCTLREVRVSRLADSVFYAVAVLADGSEVDARPSDALTLALVTGAPIAVEAAVLDAAERFARERPGVVAEASAPADSASVLADEVRARLAELARELDEPPAQP